MGSDEDDRPCPPPHASPVTLMHSEVVDPFTTPAFFNRQELRHASEDAPQLPAPRGASLSRCSQRTVADEVVVDKQEEEWLARKRMTGAIGRMVLYREGEEPVEDILGLSRTARGRLKVTALRPSGRAAMVGVEVGDQLISIDGQRPCERLEPDTVRRCLKSPANLVFLGFHGKLHAEVRVRQPDQPRCGLPAFADVTMTVQRHDGFMTDRHVSLCDPVFFQQASTSLLLEVAPQTQGSEPCSVETRDTALSPSGSSVAPDSVAVAIPRVEELASHKVEVYSRQHRDMLPRTTSRVYELQREDAKRLVRRVMRAQSATEAIE